MGTKKIGLIQNANGENSYTRLVGLVTCSLIMIGWVIVSGLQQRLVEIAPTLLGLIGICMGGNTLNKLAEATGVDKEKIIKEIVKKVKDE